MAGEIGAMISITIFILTVTFSLYALPFIFKRFGMTFSSNVIANKVIERSIWAVATYLMVLNSAIMATFAGQAAIPLTNEMFQFMWFFGRAGYVFLVYIVVRMIFDVVDDYKSILKKRRMGEDG